MNWNFEGDPPDPGWYAVLVCYDEREGVFPMGAQWSDGKWLQKGVVAYGERRGSWAEAERLAYANDPDA